jgi:RecA-family ATPase
VKGWLGSTGLSVVYGESNSGKSFFAIDFGFHVAAGEPWQGRLVKRGRVLLLAAEGAAGIPNRLKAIKLANPEFFSRAESNFSYITGQFDLRSDTHREEICALVRDQPPALLIIDTLALTFGDGLENEAGDMAQYVKQVSLSVPLSIATSC